MPHIDPALERSALESPDASFAVIVRVQGDLDARQAQIEAQGLAVTRRLSLIRGFAATATGSTIAALGANEWIVSIEPDQTVRTM